MFIDRILTLFLILGLSQLTLSAESPIKMGPMIGATSLSSTTILVQTKEAAEVKIRYWKTDDSLENALWSEPVIGLSKNGYLTKSTLNHLSSGTNYSYEVWIDGRNTPISYRKEYKDESIDLNFDTQPNWRYRKSGHEIFDFTIGMGSCAYINQPIGGFDRENNTTPYGAKYEIFEAIYEKKPDLFLWLGDTVYYREPDWTSRQGMIQRWSHDRSIPQMRPLLATIPHYAIWDDHDYGPNDIGKEFWNKALATEIFSLFHANPSAGLPELPGIFTFFNWGDVNFYLMDNRTYRDPKDLNPKPFGMNKNLLGKEQIDWLINMMVYAESQKNSSYPISFHVVAIGTQVFAKDFDSDYSSYPEEFNYLIDRMVQENLQNVIFVSGDIHYSEVNKYTVPAKPSAKEKSLVFWEITSSSLTAGSWAGNTKEKRPYRVDIIDGDNDRVGHRNFATLSFVGELGNRKIEIRYYDSNGKLVNHEKGNEKSITKESIISQK